MADSRAAESIRQNRERAAQAERRSNEIRQRVSAWQNLPEGADKYKEAKKIAQELDTIDPDPDNRELASQNRALITALTPAKQYYEGISASARKLLASGNPNAQPLIDAYNQGKPLDPIMQDAFDAYNNYYKQGQAAPGKFSSEVARQAHTQWATDSSTSGFDMFLNEVVVPAAMAYVGGSMIAGELGAGAAAGAEGTAAGTGATAGATAGTGAAAGTAAGTAGTTAGTAAGTTAGTAAGAGTGAATGAGYSGLTDAAVSTGVAEGLGSSGSSAGTAAGSAGTSAGTSASGGGYLDSLGNWVSSETGQGLLNLGAGYLQNEQNQQAANTYAQAQLEAARIAAEEARFRPVGVTTRFGKSQFGYDDKGKLTSAGYTLSPELKAQQDALMGAITGNRPQGMLQPQNPNQPVGTLPNGQPNYQYSIGRPQNPNQPGMLQVAGARANGGPVAGGQTYLVGEVGPERYDSPSGSTIVGQSGPTLFTPPASGGIVPNSQLNYAGGTPSFYGNQSNYTAMTNFNQPSSGMAYAGGSPGFYGAGQGQLGAMANPSAANNPSFSGVGQNNRQTPGAPLGANSNQFGGQAPSYQPAPVSGAGQTGSIGTQTQDQFGGQLGDVGRSPNDTAWQPAAPIQEGGLLGQAVGAQQTTAPLSQGAQSLFNLGQGYLASTPQEQAARYMQEQQALLSPSRERGLAQLQNQMYQQGRTGLAVGATDTMGAANPELEAFYNAQRQQDLSLAAQATQGGQQYAQFGAGLLDTGGEMLRGMYGTQTAAYQPYQTALGLTQNLEGMGQNAMDIGINLGAKGAASGAQAGQFLQTGASNAAEAQLPANQYSPWAGLLQGAANWY